MAAAGLMIIMLGATVFTLATAGLALALIPLVGAPLGVCRLRSLAPFSTGS